MLKSRLMGDWKDHIKLPKSSLKVKVEDNNNISGFRYFEALFTKYKKSK